MVQLKTLKRKKKKEDMVGIWEMKLSFDDA